MQLLAQQINPQAAKVKPNIPLFCSNHKQCNYITRNTEKNIYFSTRTSANSKLLPNQRTMPLTTNIATATQLKKDLKDQQKKLVKFLQWFWGRSQPRASCIS